MVLIFPAFHPCNFSLPVCSLRLDHQNPAACATKRCLSYASSKEHGCCKHYYVSKLPGFGPNSCSCIDLNLIKRLLLFWLKQEGSCSELTLNSGERTLIYQRRRSQGSGQPALVGRQRPKGILPRLEALVVQAVLSPWIQCRSSSRVITTLGGLALRKLMGAGS